MKYVLFIFLTIASLAQGATVFAFTKKVDAASPTFPSVTAANSSLFGLDGSGVLVMVANSTFLPSDTAYDATSWNGVTTIAPSKNAVRDKIETLAPAVGSSSIVTLGTVTTGTWQGTAIGDSYISSAATWNAKQAAISFGTGAESALGQNVNSASGFVTQSGGDTRYGDVLFAYKTADTSRSSANTGTNFTEDPHLTLTVPSAGTYEIELVFPWQNADATGGMKARLNFTGTWDTANSYLNYRYFVSAVALTEATGSIGYFKGSAIANPQTIIANTSRSGYVVWNGVLKFSNAGTLSIQWAQNASSATNSTLPQSTYIRLRRVGP